MLGLLCVRFSGGLFWSATAIAHAVFMLGDAALHAREMVKEKNFNPGNAGPVFFYDVSVPLAHLTLLRAYGRTEPKLRSRRRGRT